MSELCSNPFSKEDISESISLTDLFKIYSEKIAEELKVDEICLREKLMHLPSVRHYWTGVLIRHKLYAKKLEKTKAEASKKIREKLESEKIVGLNQKTIQAAIDNNSVIQQIQDSIVQNDLLIDYLQRVEQNLRQASYDYHNLLETIKLETT